MGTVLVVPCFNEAGRWNGDYWSDLFSLDDVYWLFVDDGSTDTTGSVAEATGGRHPRGSVSVLRLPENRGKGEAVRHGLLAALDHSSRPTAVGFVDADGAFVRADIHRILELQRSMSDRCDAVWSSRVAFAGRDVQRSQFRHYVSRAIATIICWRDSTIPYDTQSGLKVFAVSDTLRTVLAEPFRTRWMFELEILARWRQLEHRPLQVWEEPLLRWRDMVGSRITGREVIRIAREVSTIKRVQRKARRSSDNDTATVDQQSR